MCLFSPFPRLRLIFLFIIFAVPSLRPLSINTLPPRSLSSTTMSIAAVRLHAHIERGFAHFHGRRSPLEGVSSTTAPTPSTSTAPMEVIKLPTSVKALSGIIVVLGLCLLCEQLTIYIQIVPLNTAIQLLRFGRLGLGDGAGRALRLT